MSIKVKKTGKKSAKIPAASVTSVPAPTMSEITHRDPETLKPWDKNPRTHDERQITALMAAIQEFGFHGVIVTNPDGHILAGHGRVEAAKRLKLSTVPTVVAHGLTQAQQMGFVVADNKLNQLSDWDQSNLKNHFEMLIEGDFNVEMTGFTTAEIDLIIEDPQHLSPNQDIAELKAENLEGKPVSQIGDIWILGRHRIICSDALKMESYALLMEGKLAEMVITDPPYNVKIGGHVGGNGKIQHDEFAMASGEMDSGGFTEFLETAFTHIKEFMIDGCICYSFMDWRHQREIMNAGQATFGDLRQLIVWVKDNGGMGSFYRSQHELLYVFKNGKAPHINNFELGQHGRYRTNVWQYPGVNTFTGKGHELLKLHPTVKPVSMIADAMRDCSHQNGLILDPFAGSGTVIIAAERTGRCARAIELEPKYVDVAIRRWEHVTGELAVHPETGMTFQEMEKCGRDWIENDPEAP